MEPEAFKRGYRAPIRRIPGQPKPLAGGTTPIAVTLGEELQDGKRTGAATGDFVGTEGNTEALPDAPSRVGGGATRNDSGFADKAKVRAEFIVALR
jgi:hypothetical protein